MYLIFLMLRLESNSGKASLPEAAVEEKPEVRTQEANAAQDSTTKGWLSCFPCCARCCWGVTMCRKERYSLADQLGWSSPVLWSSDSRCCFNFLPLYRLLNMHCKLHQISFGKQAGRMWWWSMKILWFETLMVQIWESETKSCIFALLFGYTYMWWHLILSKFVKFGYWAPQDRLVKVE